MTNISKQKEINNKLEEQKNLVETIINTLPDIVWMKNKDGIYLHCNNRFTELFGNSKENIIGKCDYDFVEKDLADFFRINDKNAMNADTPIMNYETLPFASDGHTEYTQTIKTAIINNATFNVDLASPIVVSAPNSRINTIRISNATTIFPFFCLCFVIYLQTCHTSKHSSIRLFPIPPLTSYTT